MAGQAWIVDLSAPPAVPAPLRRRPGRRFVSIDELARQPEATRDDGLYARLEALADATLLDYLDWQAQESRRLIARRIAERAEQVRAAELAALWQALPTIPATDRLEIERMTRHLSDRLLRAPIEQVARDQDGRRQEAALELFGL